jgi:type IV pilus assembly protein PilY1
MKRQSIAAREVLLIALVSALAGPAIVEAQTMDQYYAQPPFVGEQVKPNILILMDNSGSMSERACYTLNCGTPTPPSTVFSAATTYNGLFDPMKCYTYDTALSAANQRFEPVSGNKATINTACSSTQWDGNFLNWATFRRFDAVKKAMVGGECYTPTAPSRNADGTCVPYTAGSSSKRTITGLRKYEQSDDGFETSPNRLESGKFEYPCAGRNRWDAR